MDKQYVFRFFIKLFFTVAACTFITRPAFADPGKVPTKLTLLADTPLYGEASDDSVQIGLISAIQSVNVSETKSGEPESWNPQEANWYLLHTSMGKGWIRNGPTVVAGDYYPVHLEVSFNREEDIYELPVGGLKSGARLAPQKVTATGQLIQCSPDVWNDNLQSDTGGCYTWYRIQTFLGEKWISPAQAIEHYESQQAEAAYTLSSAANLTKFQSKLRELEPLWGQFSVELVMSHMENQIVRLEVRKPYHHHEKLSEEEVEALKRAIFDEVGGTFPLSITTYTLSDKPNLTGQILYVDKPNQRVLIVNYDRMIGSDHQTPDASWYSMVADSNVHRNGDATKLSLDDLRVGQTVDVWSSRFTLMSYPGQTTAYELSIVKDIQLGEEGIPLSTILGVDLARIDKIELEFKHDRSIVIEEPDILQAISKRMQSIRLQGAGEYPDRDSYTYVMTIYQGNQKMVYYSNLLIQELAYKSNTFTSELDAFVLKLKTP